MHKRGLCRHAVSVCSSDTFVNSVKTNKRRLSSIVFHHRVYNRTVVLSHYRNFVKNCFITQIYTETGKSAAEAKNDARPYAILNLNKSYLITSPDCHRVPNLHFVYQMSPKSDYFCRAMEFIKCGLCRHAVYVRLSVSVCHVRTFFQND